ncbi:MAG: hypothetical protein ACYDCK_15420 [Thermoplasmatota archaeon]
MDHIAGNYGNLLGLALAVGLYAAVALGPQAGEVAATRRAAVLALGLGLWAAFFGFGVIFLEATLGLSASWAQVENLLIVAPFAGAIALWMLALFGPAARTTRAVVLALLAAMLAGFLVTPIASARGLPFASTDFGLAGVARAIGAVVLARSIFRDDLLGVPLPRIASARGTIAAASLASLFIVAQVAQNFFAAEYGLILGGVVAGAFLFAASPLQRVIEGATHRRDARPLAARSADEEHARETYRHALHLALNDGPLTDEEEARLAALADHLGLSARDAYAIKASVIDERRARA